MEGLTTRILLPTPEALAEATRLLRMGHLVAMPTETVYGLAGHAWDPVALTRIFAAKERPYFDPLIVHVAAGGGCKGSNPDSSEGPSLDWLTYLERDLGLVNLARYSPQMLLALKDLLQTFWPGPLTCVLPKTRALPDLVTSGLETVAIRVPADPVAQALLQSARMPLAAPSANRFGRISPTTAQAVYQELQGRIPLILDGGSCRVGIESTVLKPVEASAGPAFELLRPGGIPIEVLQASTRLPILDPKLLDPELLDPERGERPQAPGQLKSHYAPTKPLILLPCQLTHLDLQTFSALIQPYTVQLTQGLGILMFSGESELPQWLKNLGIPVQRAVLSQDPAEAARALFAQLRDLDQGSAGVLVSEPCPVTTSLGHAISDRLQRAAREVV